MFEAHRCTAAAAAASEPPDDFTLQCAAAEQRCCCETRFIPDFRGGHDRAPPPLFTVEEPVSSRQRHPAQVPVPSERRRLLKRKGKEERMADAARKVANLRSVAFTRSFPGPSRPTLTSLTNWRPADGNDGRQRDICKPLPGNPSGPSSYSSSSVHVRRSS